MKETIKEFIEDNNKLLIIGFTLYGAIHQIIRLLYISSDSINFFSLTTAINDSIKNLINFLGFILLSLIYRYIIRILFLDFSLILESYKGNKVSKWFLKNKIIIHLSLSFILLILYWRFNIRHLSISLIIFGSLFTSLYLLLFKCIPKIIGEGTKEYQYLTSLVILIMFPFIFPSLTKTHNVNNFSNTNRLVSIIKKENQNIEEVDIKYYNDKFIFIITTETIDKKLERSLLVKKIDELFK